MATIKSADQISIIDVTDAYSVILTSESHTFPGSTSAALAGSVTTQIIAMRGTEQMNASVTVSEITKPTGVTVSSDGDSTAPTLTIAVTSSVTSGGVIKIPVHIGDITITKEFSFAIAFKGSTGATGATGATGNGVASTEITYQAANSGTDIPSGTWLTSIPSVNAGQYLWTRTVITYTDNTTSTSYSVGMMGATGATGETGATGKGVKSTSVTYQKGTSGTTAPTGTWSTTIPSVGASEYLWTRTVITYTDNTTSTSYSVGMMGATGAKGDKGDTGAAGADAITLSITSSNGTIFKNSSITTVLTAHVYKAGTELTATEIAALGTVKWYKDGSTTAEATGTTLTIDAGEVTNKATYIAQLEG
ncbi:MAG: hypothetical protein ACI39R_01015 [Lachnospiraceae bacterium]